MTDNLFATVLCFILYLAAWHRLFRAVEASSLFTRTALMALLTLHFAQFTVDGSLQALPIAFVLLAAVTLCTEIGLRLLVRPKLVRLSV